MVSGLTATVKNLLEQADRVWVLALVTLTPWRAVDNPVNDPLVTVEWANVSPVTTLIHVSPQRLPARILSNSLMKPRKEAS